MNTSAFPSYVVSPLGANILVSHSNAMVSAGLVATMQRISGCEVQSSAGGDGFDSPFRGVDLLVADSASLDRWAAKQGGRGPNGVRPKPHIVLMAATSEAAAAAGPFPPEISAYLSMNCAQDDLLKTVCSLIGSVLPPGASIEPPSASCPRGGIAPSALRRVREHVEMNLGERIDVGHLATLTGLSACHFSRAFKQSVGMPPHRYLTSRRILAAAKMIESTNLPMAEIALELGFSDQSHFTRVFTAHIGQSPSRFRHQRR
jgi:AraC-like DNA-binding protein